MIPEFKKKSKIKPKDPFFGYFLSGVQDRFKQGILQSHISSFWSRLISRTVSQGKYTYLQSSESKSTKNVTLKNNKFLNISSYDYLGLIGNDEIESSAINAIKDYGTSTGGVRILSGSHIMHEELEYKLARFKGTEASLTFTSGYMANLAIASALIEKEDKVFVDEKIHKSVIDALFMSQANFEKFKHNDVSSLESRLEYMNVSKRVFVIVEGIYSMDGSILNLPELIALKKKYDFFLIVDEAHSFGVIGKTGRGVHEHFGVPANEVDIWTSSLSKAIPSNGGFIAGSRELIIFMQHQSSPFIFSTALNLGSVAAIMKALEIIEKSNKRIEKLWDNTNYFLKACRELGFNMGLSESPVTPVIVGGRKETLDLSAYLYNHYILAPAAVFPAVPFNQGRLRICMSSGFSRNELDYIIETIDSGLKYNAHTTIIQEYS
jgi:8-amino-7-oxononanoate synthase